MNTAQKTFFFIMIIVGLLIPFTALGAEGDYYLKGSFGFVSQSDSSITVDGFNAGNISFDNGTAIAGAVGKEMKSSRVEFELFYEKTDNDRFSDTTNIVGSGPIDGDLSALQLLVNYYYDFNKGKNLMPYVGGGLGLFLIKFYDGVDTLESNNFGFQIGGGLGIQAGKSTIIDLGFRYTNTLANPEDNFGGVNFELEYSNIAFLVGIRVSI